MTKLKQIVEEKSTLQRSQVLVQKMKNNRNIKIQFFGEGLPLITSKGEIKELNK